MKLKGLLFAILATLALQLAAQSEISSTLTKENAKTCYEEFRKIFTDGSCSELIQPYSAMTDEELKTYFWDFPQELIDIAIKVKNNAWAPREKEFRVAEYEPHSNVSRWGTQLNTYQYSYINHPTGITATTGDTLLIFIDNVNQGTFLKLIEIKKNEPFSEWSVYDSEKIITKGLNLVTVAQPDVTLFITYSVTTDTTATSPRLADYPKAKIHIEGGKINGYFDKSRHTDEDWRDMLANHFKHYSVQVKGERVLFHMERENIAKVCPNTITDAIGWWDQCVQWQHELMGADKYHDRWNSLLMARDGYENMYMYASMNYTYYEYYTIKDILPWETVYNNHGFMWGPAHEIGHINQGAINIVSCTEASNNLFSNAHLFRVGKSTTRGDGVANCAKDFNNKVAFPLRNNVIGKSRMFFQLYLYFHAAKKDTTFYPRLFDALRADRLIKVSGGQTQAKDDQLKFAEKCCEIAQMDLSEFFEAWGFFEPMTGAHVGDYGNYYVNLTKEEAEESRARMQQYEKKGTHLMFIEDRIKPSKRTDGVDGYKVDFNDEYAVGKMGDVGQWEDYIDESVKAEGYYFVRKNKKITIYKDKNAKGALGFKLYDADTEQLLAFSNTYSIDIPSHAPENLKVVASQADGTNIELLNVAESDDDALQKLALEADLSLAQSILRLTTNDGSAIGKYYLEYATELKETATKVKEIIENNDTTEHSFAEWRNILNEEIKKLTDNPDARSTLKELDIYEISSVAKYEHYICDDSWGLKGENNNSEKRHWMVESAGEPDWYYIINEASGRYINNVEVAGSMCAGRTSLDAVKFKVYYLDNSAVYFITENGLYLAINDENKIVGSESLNNSSMWYVDRLNKNSAIDEVTNENAESKTIYDLSGRKVETPATGIYIINGKKIIVK